MELSEFDFIIDNMISEINKKENKSYYEMINNIMINYYYALYLNNNYEIHNNKYFIKAQMILDKICSEKNIYEIPLGSSYGYVMLGYIAHSLNHNGKYKCLIEKINKLIVYYSNKIIDEYDWEKYGIKNAYYDVVYGLCGVAHYFHYYNKDIPIRKKILNWLIDLYKYENTSIPTGLYIFPHNINNTVFKTRYKEGYIDLGLSHGMAGILAVLFEGYEDNIEIKGLHEVIESIYFLFDKRKMRGDNWLSFPSILYKENGELIADYEVRYSWCYGSLGITKILYKITMNDKTFYKNHKLFENNMTKLKKNTTEVYGYSDPMFCHGYSGLYHILNLYQFENSRLNFDKAIEDVEQQIWKYYDNNNKIFKIESLNKKPKEILVENSIIDGIGSIIIPLLIHYTGQDYGCFSKILFLK